MNRTLLPFWMSLTLSACATLQQPPTAPAPLPPPPPKAASSCPFSSAQLPRPKAFAELERLQQKNKGRKIQLTRRFVDELLRAESKYKTSCERLGGQLEALKSIDTEDPGSVIP